MADSDRGTAAGLSALQEAAELNAANDREILKVLTQILEGARHREQELHDTLEKVTKSLEAMTRAFEKQGEAVSRLLDLRNRVKDLELALAEEQRKNQEVRTKLAIFGKVFWPGVTTVIGAAAMALLALMWSGPPPGGD